MTISIDESRKKEQAGIFGQAITASKAEQQVPKTRGEVAAQEQMRILQQGMGV